MARTAAAERWSDLIDQHEASGLTIRAFAEKVDINPRTLAWWRSQLGRSKKGELGRPKKCTEAKFVELTVAKNPEDPDAVDPTVVLALDGYAAHVVVDHDTDLALPDRMLTAFC